MEASGTSLLAVPSLHSDSLLHAEGWQEQSSAALSSTGRLYRLASAALRQLSAACDQSMGQPGCVAVEELSPDAFTLKRARAYVDVHGVYYNLTASLHLALSHRVLLLSLFEQPAKGVVSLLQAELSAEGPLLLSPLDLHATSLNADLEAPTGGLSEEEAQMYGASPPPPPPPPLAFVGEQFKTALNCTIRRVEVVGGIRVPVESSPGTLASGYANQLDHQVLSLSPDYSSADVDVFCYAGCGPDALVLQAEEEGSLHTYQPFQSSPISLACAGTMSVSASLYPQGGAMAQEELLARVQAEQTTGVTFASGVQTLPAFRPHLLYRIELALSVPTSDLSSFKIRPSKASVHCMLAHADVQGVDTLARGGGEVNLLVSVPAGELGSAFLMACNSSGVFKYVVAKASGANEYVSRAIAVQTSTEPQDAGDQLLHLLSWHVPPSSFHGELVALASELSSSSCAWWMQDQRAMRQRFRAIALAAATLKATLSIKEDKQPSSRAALPTHDAHLPNKGAEAIQAAFDQVVSDAVARSELSRLLLTLRTPHLCSPSVPSFGEVAGRVADTPSLVLHGSRRPCASAYDCEPSESCAAATQKEMAVLGVAKVCQALLLSTDSAGHGTSLDTTGACAPHLWVDGYRPRGCQLWRHVLLLPASSEPPEGRMEESVRHWAQALKPDDGRSYRVAAYT
ncbi:MAG: hypothetical protein SGPRY_013095, partial [Prymnesium sp.]